MKVGSILNTGNVRVLLYLYNNDKKARYSELLREVIVVRSTLAYVLSELEEEELIKRKVINTKPIQVVYSLTEKGEKIAKHFLEIRNILREKKFCFR